MIGVAGAAAHLAIRAGKYLLPGLILAAVIAVAGNSAYRKGYEARDTIARLEIAEIQHLAELHRSALLDNLNRTMTELSTIQADAEARVRVAETEGRVIVRTVERLIHESPPDFTDTRRPAQLQRMRDQQLAALAAAAAAAPAAKLPRSSAHALSSANDSQ
jgi:hypothetical protein